MFITLSVESFKTLTAATIAIRALTGLQLAVAADTAERLWESEDGEIILFIEESQAWQLDFLITC